MRAAEMLRNSTADKALCNRRQARTLCYAWASPVADARSSGETRVCRHGTSPAAPLGRPARPHPRAECFCRRGEWGLGLAFDLTSGARHWRAVSDAGGGSTTASRHLCQWKRLRLRGPRHHSAAPLLSQRDRTFRVSRTSAPSTALSNCSISASSTSAGRGIADWASSRRWERYRRLMSAFSGWVATAAMPWPSPA
jgi:hypothetical protein